MDAHYTPVSREYGGGAHYSIFRTNHELAEDALRKMFPEGEANEMNFVLFSTSGVHGSYATIEDAHAAVASASEDESTDVTFLIVQPRLVCLRYGNVTVTDDNVEYLKKLRASSLAVVSKIGLGD